MARAMSSAARSVALLASLESSALQDCHQPQTSLGSLDRKQRKVPLLRDQNWGKDCQIALLAILAHKRYVSTRSEPTAFGAGEVNLQPTELQIRDIIKSHPVVMFSKTFCPFCFKAKAAFAAEGVQVKVTIDTEMNMSNYVMGCHRGLLNTCTVRKDTRLQLHQ
eukprot:838959-Amphidinium_carterae.1